MFQIVFKIEKLDIAESYFKGKVRLEKDEFTINIQDERRGKVLRLPMEIKTEKNVLVRCTGPGVFVEDFLEYRGISEWLKLILLQSHFTSLIIRINLILSV